MQQALNQSRAQQPVTNIGLTFTLAQAQPNTRLTKARVWLNKKGSAWRPRFDSQRLEYVQGQKNKLVPQLIKILISLRDNPWHQKRVRLIFRFFLASPWPWREKLCFLVFFFYFFSFFSASSSFFLSFFLLLLLLLAPFDRSVEETDARQIEEEKTLGKKKQSQHFGAKRNFFCKSLVMMKVEKDKRVRW